jgi:hypothetical protein
MGKHTSDSNGPTTSGETVIHSSHTTTDASGRTHTETHTVVQGPGSIVINGDNHGGIQQSF